jgi:hypothetical protein
VDGSQRPEAVWIDTRSYFPYIFREKTSFIILLEGVSKIEKWFEVNDTIELEEFRP